MERVSERVGRGLTLKLALAAERCQTVNEETWKKALQSHAEFVPVYEAGKAKFLELATWRLAESEDLANLRWLLERRHADLFARPAAVNVSVNTETHIAGLSDDVLERARVIARTEAKVEDGGSRIEDGDKA